ncbi:MAG: phosphoribosyltransferase family protein [Gammaproteobacteria bacterium]|nr:phosphoribosyltransferase family protein [Gammaproteobacteria bacterium]
MKKKILGYVRKKDWSDDRSFVDRGLISMYDSYRQFRQWLKKIDDPNYSRAFLRAKNFKRSLAGKKYKFVSIDQATTWTNEWIKTFPEQYDLIVGVPRSGMLIASIVALRLGKGLTTPDLLLEGQYWHSNRAGARLPIDQFKKILLIDDALDKGRAMAKAKDIVLNANPNCSITCASLIVREKTRHLADLYHITMEPPRTYEWNLMHRKIASYAGRGILAVDMDGVLCANPPKGADDDEAWYLEWLENANPYLIPGFEIDVILTSRLEKYRGQTENWLRKHQVRYKELHMWDVPDKSMRKGFAKYKSNALLSIKPDMYWESDWELSQKIWDQTRIPTLCIDEMTMLS